MLGPGLRPTTGSLTDELSTAKQRDPARKHAASERSADGSAPLMLYPSPQSHEIWLCLVECLSQLLMLKLVAVAKTPLN